jgi:O-antigen/teichoic acid export membrane protein
MIAVRTLDRGLGFISTIVLARLLVPEDFGLVAMATSVLALLEMLSAFGFDVALIRQTSSDRTDYDTAWTFNVLVGLTVALVLVLLAYPAARFYGEPRLVRVMFVLAAAPLCQGLENIGVVAFRKDLNFRTEFMWLTGRRLISFVTVLPLAFLLRSYWALVAGIVIGRGAGMLLSYVVHPYRPRFSFARRLELLGFSKWVVTVNILSFFLQRGSDLIVGRGLGSGPLGIYSIAVEVASLPTSELVAPINRAVYPAFSKIAHDRPQLKQEYLGVMSVIALVAIPMAMGLAAVGAQVVILLLGEKWLPAVPLINALAFLGAVQFPHTNAYSVFLAIGKPQYQVRLHSLQLPILMLSMIVLTSQYGLVGAAWATVATGFIITPMSLAVIFRELEIRIVEFVRIVWRPVVAAAVMYGVMTAGGHVPVPHGLAATLIQLAVLLSTGAVTYVLAVLGLWWGVGAPASAERKLLTQMRDLLRRWISGR